MYSSCIAKRLEYLFAKITMKLYHDFAIEMCVKKCNTHFPPWQRSDSIIILQFLSFMYVLNCKQTEMGNVIDFDYSHLDNCVTCWKIIYHFGIAICVCCINTGII